jgi:HK97 family phage prohead protease
MEKLIKILRAEVKDINADKHTLTAVISNKKVDRDGDVVEPEAFRKNLKSYKEHPVLLSSHDYWDLRKQIGKAINIKINDNDVEATFEYFVGGQVKNEEAEWAWVLAQKGLASYSIGFMGNKFDWIKDKDEEGNERITGRKFTEIELLEVSQVLVPSNRGALQQDYRISQEKAELCELVNKSFKDEEFKIEQKPKPQEGESREDFMSRCIPILINEGKDKDQAVAICSSIFDNKAHYSDKLLGNEGQDPISEPQSKELEIGDVKKVINEAVKERSK